MSARHAPVAPRIREAERASLQAGRAAGSRQRAVRRRRAFFTLALAAVGLSLGLWANRAEATAPAPDVAIERVTVQAGDTLWSFAERLAKPGQDVRVVVAELQELNGMAGAGLTAGQSLTLPARP